MLPVRLLTAVSRGRERIDKAAKMPKTKAKNPTLMSIPETGIRRHTTNRQRVSGDFLKN